MKRKLILIAFIGCISSHAFGQVDEHFSMYSETKMQINPAATGFFEARYKFFTNFRRQYWAIPDQPATSFSASFDARIIDNLDDGKFIGGGLYFSNDLSGDLKYNQLNIAVPVNYSIRIGKLNKLAAGIAPGYFQRSIADNSPTWDNQWSNRDGFVQTSPSGEQIFNSQEIVGRFDLAAGLYWEFNYDEFVFMSMGLSGSHLTRPKINYLPEDNRMYRTMNLHYFGNFGQEDFPLTFRPSVMWTIQKSQQSLVFGTTIDILLKEESQMTKRFNRTSIELGGHFRYGDAVIGSIALHTGGMSFGASYDYAISGINNIGVGGATEFFMYYRMGSAKGPSDLELVYPE